MFYDRHGFGPIIVTEQIQKVGGGTTRVSFQHPIAALAAALEDRSEFSALLEAGLAKNNWTLSILLYSDEIVPGNVIAPDNRRKSWALYWSMWELGSQALHNENAWLTGFTLRTDTVDQIEGGLSATTRRFLQFFLRR